MASGSGTGWQKRAGRGGGGGGTGGREGTAGAGRGKSRADVLVEVGVPGGLVMCEGLPVGGVVVAVTALSCPLVVFGGTVLKVVRVVAVRVPEGIGMCVGDSVFSLSFHQSWLRHCSESSGGRIGW